MKGQVREQRGLTEDLALFIEQVFGEDALQGFSRVPLAGFRGFDRLARGSQRAAGNFSQGDQGCERLHQEIPPQRSSQDGPPLLP
ncbi:hypothetical protein [Gulosibacter molinativorax]|uniref:Uncharacterized protein n=1 Tax=Gulosibacter molinativorax TaxID=256821 RepID=A0ABT7C844_9MICO|nr:hypothetical protein [Gulosibacter molinativorax]MDJ1370902.1 hypothetical protein [Gulosibacter molinativorax]